MNNDEIVEWQRSSTTYTIDIEEGCQREEMLEVYKTANSRVSAEEHQAPTKSRSPIGSELEIVSHNDITFRHRTFTAQPSVLFTTSLVFENMCSFLEIEDVLNCRLACKEIDELIVDNKTGALKRFFPAVRSLQARARGERDEISKFTKGVLTLVVWSLFMCAAYFGLSFSGILDGTAGPGAGIGTIIFIVLVIVFTDTVPVMFLFLIDNEFKRDVCLRVLGMLIVAPLLTLSVILFWRQSRYHEWYALDQRPTILAECPPDVQFDDGMPTYVKFNNTNNWWIDPAESSFRSKTEGESGTRTTYHFRWAYYRGSLEDLFRIVSEAGCSRQYNISALKSGFMNITWQNIPTEFKLSSRSSVSLINKTIAMYRANFSNVTLLLSDDFEHRQERWLRLKETENENQGEPLTRSFLFSSFLPRVPVYGMESLLLLNESASPQPSPTYRTIHKVTNAQGWLAAETLLSMDMAWDAFKTHTTYGYRLVTRDGLYPVDLAKKERDLALYWFIGVIAFVLLGSTFPFLVLLWKDNKTYRSMVRSVIKFSKMFVNESREHFEDDHSWSDSDVLCSFISDDVSDIERSMSTTSLNSSVDSLASRDLVSSFWSSDEDATPTEVPEIVVRQPTALEDGLKSADDLERERISNNLLSASTPPPVSLSNSFISMSSRSRSEDDD